MESFANSDHPQSSSTGSALLRVLDVMASAIVPVTQLREPTLCDKGKKKAVRFYVITLGSF